MGQPSSKTDYVVVGEGAGQSKLAALKKHNIKTLNEDAFLNLIATRKGLGKGKVDEKTKKKQEKEEKEIKAAAAEIAKREAKAKKEASYAKSLFSNLTLPLPFYTVLMILHYRRNYGQHVTLPRILKKYVGTSPK